MPANEPRPLRSGDLAAASSILARCFTAGDDPADMAAWIDRIGRDRVRVLGDPAQALLGIVPMGQWFGGRSVPVAGIAGVGVDPTQRGRGLARRLMTAVLHEARELGLPLSTLFASTYALYRGVGYERAGGRYQATVETARVDAGAADVELVEVTDRLRPATRALYDALARRTNGHLDRGDYIWNRVENPRDGRLHAYAVAGEPLRGYASWVQRRSDEGSYELHVGDFQAADAEAARALLGLFAAHRSLAPRVRWSSAPNDPKLALLRERFYRLEQQEQWMLRVVDVKGALEARGWPAGLEAELELRVRDPLLPWNDGAFVLRVAGGSGEVTVGGSGALELSERGLAALYSGHLSPWDLRLAGQLDGPDPALGTAAALFAGGAPWMPDMF